METLTTEIIAPIIADTANGIADLLTSWEYGGVGGITVARAILSIADPEAEHTHDNVVGVLRTLSDMGI